MSDTPIFSVSNSSLIAVRLPETPKSIDKSLDKLLTPTSKWLGKCGGGLSKGLYAAIAAPVEAWADRRILQIKRVSEQIQERLQFIPEDRRIEPTLAVVNAVDEGLESCLDDVDLEAGFINLLTASMDSMQCSSMIKSHANTLKQLCSDEAKIMTVFAQQTKFPFITVKKALENGEVEVALYITNIQTRCQCQSPKLIPAYFVHLETLGLIKINTEEILVNDDFYKEIESTEEIQMLKMQIETGGNKYKGKKGLLSITPLGSDFVKACGLSCQS